MTPVEVMVRNVSVDAIRGMRLSNGVELVFATSPPYKHFFGYYDKSPLDGSGTRLLCHRYSGNDLRLTGADDFVEVGFVDLRTETFNSLGRSAAFNWQQGCMLQWLGPDYRHRIVFNDRETGTYVARTVEVESGRTCTLPGTVYSVSPDGRWAISPSFERHEFCRPGYCYTGAANQQWRHPRPEDDGVFRVEITQGARRLIISMRQLLDWRPVATMTDAEHYVEHMLVGPDSRRFIFLHRWRLEDGGVHTRMFSADPFGQELRMFPDSGNYSHQAWVDAREVVVTGRAVSIASRLRYSDNWTRRLIRPVVKGLRYLPQVNRCLSKTRLAPYAYLRFDCLGQSLGTVDDGRLGDGGHPSFHPFRRDWMLSDTYPDETGWQELYVFHVLSRRKVLVGLFWTPPEYRATGFRCDLHPRWDRTGRRVVIDSLCNGTRQMYVLDINRILERQ